jgi:hypothetical protein
MCSMLKSSRGFMAEIFIDKNCKIKININNLIMKLMQVARNKQIKSIPPPAVVKIAHS